MLESLKNYSKVVMGINKIRYTWLVMLSSVIAFVYGITDTSQPLGNPVWAFAVITFFIAFMYLFMWLRWGSIHYYGFTDAAEALKPHLKAESGSIITYDYARPMDGYPTPGEIPVDRYYMSGTSLAIKHFHKTRKVIKTKGGNHGQ